MATDTARQITEAAIKTICQHGYQSISLRKLAGQLGLTTGAVYKHFANKDELFYQCSRTLYQQLQDQLQLTDDQGPFNQLLEVVTTMCHLFADRPLTMEFLFFCPSLISAYQHKGNSFPFLKLTRELCHQVNPGRVSDEQLFIQMWSFVQGYGLLLTNGTTTFDQEMIQTTVYQLCQNAG